ncbi:endothelin-converting enzyme-like 1 [Drosophila eugracilis]|uniref:endothelin-converting enzyme-like 1 n=1 Tax=Drosophila eugracilis TaxID=29029 RepID=UPI0007E8897E|nr:endothelin-converting enzyme-like 1 [Drosophila eugracilis]
MRLEVLLVASLVGLLPILVKSDPQSNPCHNFYEAACGNWSAIHAKDPYSTVTEQLDMDYAGKLADLLDKEKGDNEPRFLQLLRNFYTSCRQPLTMDQTLELLRQLIMMPWINDNMLAVGMTAAFRIDVLADIKKSNLGTIWKQLLIRSTPWNLNETNRELMTREQFDLLWPAESYYDPDFFWSELSNLESNIMRNATLDSDDDSTEDVVDGWPEELIPTFWILPWPKALPTYSYINRLIYSLSHTSHKFLLIYLYLRLKLIQGPIEPWHVDRVECAGQSRMILSHPAVWLIEQNHPRLQLEPVLQDIFIDLKQRFGQKLRANRNHFPLHINQFLLTKLKRMTLRLSILPKGSAKSVERQIDRYYTGVRITPTDYFGNLLNALQYHNFQGKYRARSMPNRNSFVPVNVHEYGTFASPFYMTENNMLIVPLSLLGPPIYTPDQPDILTYSSLGFILGHELTHGYDPGNVFFNSRGVISPMVKRSLNMNSRFRDELKCLNHWFGDGRDEKYSDSNGLELAYSAYFDTAPTDHKRTKNEEDLMVQKQQFFYNWAQFFCSDDIALMEQYGSNHGNDRSRINDAVATFKPFRETFDCGPTLRQQCRLF